MSSHARHRRRMRFDRRTPPGAPPGSLVTDPRAKTSVIDVIAYGQAGLVEMSIKQVRDLAPLLSKYSVVWVNVAGLRDAALLEELRQMFALHRLAMEDAINLHQRAKVERYGDHLFIVARMARDSEKFESEQLSLFLGKNFVVSLIEDPGDCLEAVRQRLRTAAGSIRAAGPDYLVYAILDATVDHYFPVLERLGERLDGLEDEVLERPEKTSIGVIHDTKHELLAVRRALWPHREATNALCHDPSGLVSKETQVYLRDCYDHVIQLIDLLETYRELAADLRDAYLSSVSNRMNEVMKVLTVIATIFMPLTFITGIYGMNFNTEASPFNMPELNARYGYLGVWTTMVCVVLAMLAFFWHRGWLRSLSPGGDMPLRRTEKTTPP